MAGRAQSPSVPSWEMADVGQDALLEVFGPSSYQTTILAMWVTIARHRHHEDNLEVLEGEGCAVGDRPASRALRASWR